MKDHNIHRGDLCTFNFDDGFVCMFSANFVMSMIEKEIMQIEGKNYYIGPGNSGDDRDEINDGEVDLEAIANGIKSAEDA